MCLVNHECLFDPLSTDYRKHNLRCPDSFRFRLSVAMEILNIIVYLFKHIWGITNIISSCRTKIWSSAVSKNGLFVLVWCVFPLIVLKSGCSVSLTVSIDFISAMTEHRAKMQTFSGPHTHKHRTAYKDTYADTDVHRRRLEDNRLINRCCSVRLLSSDPLLFTLLKCMFVCGWKCGCVGVWEREKLYLCIR